MKAFVLSLLLVGTSTVMAQDTNNFDCEGDFCKNLNSEIMEKSDGDIFLDFNDYGTPFLCNDKSEDTGVSFFDKCDWALKEEDAGSYSYLGHRDNVFAVLGCNVGHQNREADGVGAKIQEVADTVNADQVKFGLGIAGMSVVTSKMNEIFRCLAEARTEALSLWGSKSDFEHVRNRMQALKAKVKLTAGTVAGLITAMDAVGGIIPSPLRENLAAQKTKLAGLALALEAICRFINDYLNGRNC